jgi:hypothetical protein
MPLYLLTLLIWSLTKCNTQQLSPFDKSKVVKASELNFAFSNMRGLTTDSGMTFLVEQNMKELTAYKTGKLQWKANIIAKCGEPKVGKAEIRFIKIDGNKINVVFGKHSFASVLVANGNVECLGSD